MQPSARTLPPIDQSWFRIHCLVRDLSRAWGKYQDWLRKGRLREEPYHHARKVLQFTSGLSPSGIGAYLSQNPKRWKKVSAKTVRDLGGIWRALNQNLPPIHAKKLRVPRSQRSNVWRISLLTNLQDVPSPSYHLHVLKELVESARARNIVLAVHHLGGSPKEVENRLEWLVAHDCPDGLIWLRLTPEGVVPTIPSVVVHGAQRDYSQPVLAHVLPDQRKLHDELRTWLRNAAGAGKSRNVPIFCMPEENELETGPSIRNERIRAVKQGIKEAGFEARLVDVADYTGVTAIAAIGEIVKHGGAPVYVCLSDNIAATLLHVLALYREDARHKVLGFDNTNLARSLGFASVDQGLGEIADKVWTLFDACFRTRRRACSQFEEVRVPLRIVVNQKREWAPAH